MACTGLLGDCCLESGAAGTTRELAAAMLGWLKGGVRERQTLPALLPFGKASAHDPEVHLGEHSRRLYDALRRLLNDVGEAQRIDSLGSIRIVLGLMADVLSMFLHQFDLPSKRLIRLLTRSLARRWTAISKPLCPLLSPERLGRLWVVEPEFGGDAG